MKTAMLPVLLGLLVTSGCVLTTPANDSVTRAKEVNEARPAPVKEKVAEFLVEAVDARRMDYAEGKLAAERGTTQAIRAYGLLMVRDQNELLDELNALAAKREIAVPETIGAEKLDHLRELRELNGRKFDKAFISSMTIDHRRDVREFERASQFEQRAVSDYAARRLPLIRAHLEKIEAIHDDYKEKAE